ncbi:DUF4192 family protein [Microbacterium tumbae]
MTTLMKATGSADFLGMVPALAGCTPTRSIVLLPFEGRRTYGALRMDLPDDEHVEDFVEQAAALASRVEHADAVALVVYCDQKVLPTPEGLVLPHAVLVDRMIDELEDARLDVVDALCATPEGWSSYLDEDPRLRPLPPRRELPGGRAVLDGDQNDGADGPPVDLAEKERVGRALAALREVAGRLCCSGRPDDGRTDPQAIAALAMLDDMPLFAERMLHAEDPAPFETAAMLWVLEQPVFRDAVLMQWTTDREQGEEALARQLSFRSEGTLPAPEHGRILMGEGPRPDPARLERMLRAALALSARAPRRQRVGPLSLAAWASWALGRSTHAAHHLAKIHAIDPEYGLARLLNTLMSARPLPEWAFRRPSADAR